MAIQLTAEENVLRQGAKRASESGNESLMDTYSSQLDKRLTDRGALTETKGNPREQAKGLRPAQQMLSAVEPTVSATELAEPTTPVRVPEPEQATIPAGPLNVARNVSRNAQGFIEAQTAEQQRLRELQETFGGLGEQESLSDVFQQQREQFGATPEALNELQDIQLRLNDMNTESGVTQTRIEGAAGQTLPTAQREVTQEQRENAVRTAGLAARAAVIQGNIETATQLARDAVNIEYQQRQLTANNLIRQIDMVQGQVDDQTAQLLEQEKRQYEAELATIQEVKDSVANAMVNGATQAEIAQLTSDQMPDAEKIALAKQITARGANEMRDLEIQDARSAIAARNAGVAQGWARIDMEERKFNYAQQQDALETELAAMQEAGQITEEQAANQKKVESALRLQDLTQQIRGHAGFNLSVGSVGSRVFNAAEGGLAGQIYNYLSGQGEGFDALYDQLTESLTLDNLDKMSGVLTDRDIQVLRSAATRLRKTTTEEEFLNTLDEMDQVFQRTVDENGITPQQAQFYYGADQETLDEVNAIYGDNVTNTTTNSINFDY